MAKFPMTPRGVQTLREELKRLREVERPKNVRDIEEARAHGDLKENAEYHAAKDEQGLMESKIRKMQQMLRDPEIVEAPPVSDQVGPGMLVTIRPLDEDDPDDETYLLAEHTEEKAPGARTVTTESPLGTALMGATAGQEVAYQAPGGTVKYSVVSFEPHTG